MKTSPPRALKNIFRIGLGIFLGAPSFAQEPVEPAELLQSTAQFLQDNLDESALEALGVDAHRVQKFLAELQKGFQGTYVVDVAALRDTAQQILPTLEQFEETAPYAAWLKSRLDYFDVAEKLRAAANAAPVPKISPAIERKVWIETLTKRPMPPLAFPQIAPLKKIFSEERVPPELVWVAEVESSFNAKARSPAGAAGLFQLMPATARALDLSVGIFRDERLQPEKNARAAAQYLRQLHRRFGDGRLALAAYNAGPARVAELLKKHAARTFDDIANYLPAETQLYVPKVEATLRQREGRALSDLKWPKG